jgi:hypothetical protein
MKDAVLPRIGFPFSALIWWNLNPLAKNVGGILLRDRDLGGDQNPGLPHCSGDHRDFSDSDEKRSARH